MSYVYLLKSQKTDTYYVGSTRDLRKRLYTHNQGMNRATKAYRPWELVYYEAYRSEKAARTREQVLKSHGRTLSALKRRIQTGKSI